MDALYYYLVIQLLAFISLPLCQRIFCNLPDKGYTLSKTFGLFLTGYTTWLLSTLGLFPRLTHTGVIALPLLFFAAIYANSKIPLRITFRKRSTWLFEALFLFAYLFWLFVRWCSPALSHTEQPMDLMMLQAITQSTSYPIQDLWLAGFPLSYYYFGYWLQVIPAQWIRIPPSTTYHIAQAMWFSLIFLACFGMGYNLVRIRKRSTVRAVFSGTIVALSVLLISNVQGFIDALHAPTNWWWWKASRAVHDGTTPLITEFPFFSFLLGDMHPHVLILPLMLLLCAWCLQRLQQTCQPSHAESTPTTLIRLLFPTLLVSTFFMTNAWNWPIDILLLCLTLLLSPSPFRQRLYQLALLVLLLIAGFIIVLFPYHLTAQSQVEGIALFHGLHTQLKEFLLLFGWFIPGILLLLGKLIQRTWLKRRFPVPARFLFLLFIAGSVCVLLPEELYIRDVFNNRMNTVFKFYYQAWLLLALAASATLTLSLSDGYWRLLAWSGTLLLALGLLYPARALYDRTNHFTPSQTGLNGSAWIRTEHPEQANALEWITKNTPPQARFLTAPGTAYQPLSALVSTYTGRPQLLGWTGHERQWRGADYNAMTTQRLQLIDLCLKNGTPQQIAAHPLWSTLNFLYLGPHERTFSSTTSSPIEQMTSLVQLVYSNTEVRIYEPLN